MSYIMIKCVQLIKVINVVIFVDFFSRPLCSVTRQIFAFIKYWPSSDIIELPIPVI